MQRSKETKKVLLARVKRLEDAIAKGHEYLESGKHAHWHGFRPLYSNKLKDSRALPPHKDWVRNVFLPRQEKALKEAEKALEKVERTDPSVTSKYS